MYVRVVVCWNAGELTVMILGWCTKGSHEADKDTLQSQYCTMREERYRELTYSTRRLAPCAGRDCRRLEDTDGRLLCM